MLRRDFMKFVSLLGIPLVPLGVPTSRTVWATAQFPDGVVPIQNGDALKMTYRPRKDSVSMVFTFDDGQRVTIEADEGYLTYSERQEFLSLFERGVLIEDHKCIGWCDFHLACIATTISDKHFMSKLRGTIHYNMDVVTNGRTYSFQDCLWKTLEHDFNRGTFSITGSARDHCNWSMKH